MILFAAAAAAAAQQRVVAQPVIPPAPMVVALQAPPPITTVVAPVRAVGDIYPTLTSGPAIPIRVRVSANGRQLLDDTFRVARSAGASYQESRSEAPEAVCSTDRYYGSQERYSLNLNVYLRDDLQAAPMVNVSVTWQRPSKGVSCGAEGSRQVQLSQTVPLAPGQSVTIPGDAGLTVTLSR